MHKNLSSSRSRSTALVFELLLLSALVVFTSWVARSSLMAAQPQLIGHAIMVDLTFTAGVCHWLLGVRIAGLPRWTFVPLLAAGLALSKWFVPTGAADTTAFAIIVAAVVESSALVLLLLNVRRITREVRAARRSGVNGFDAVEASLLRLAPSVPWLVSYARFELQLWSMFCFGWFLRPRPADGPDVFTHHKTTHWFGVVGVIAFLALMEAIVLHIALDALRYEIAKWVMSALSAYGLIWILGDMQALRVYRSAIVSDTLLLRVGARGHAEIPLSNLKDVELGTWSAAGPDEALLVLSGKANVRLTFHAPNTYKPALGAQRCVRALLTQIDNPEALRNALARRSLGCAQHQSPGERRLRDHAQVRAEL